MKYPYGNKLVYFEFVFVIFVYLLCSIHFGAGATLKAEEITCTVISDWELECNGIVYDEKSDTLSQSEVALFIVISIILILCAGLMSGLTIGLMSLDLMNLRILKESGTSTEKRHASKILPLVERRHHLLVTLLLTNAAAMEALPIFLDRLSSPVTAVLISVTAVLLFGEIIPQALCVRFGLAIGANTAWLVKILMYATFIVTWPIGKLLDFLLGHGDSPLYRRAELKELVTMHAMVNRGPLTTDECNIIRGALDMKTKTVADCLTLLDKVFMVDINGSINKETLMTILKDGHSRIPVFDGTRQNLVGLLLTKTLLLLNPNEEKPIKEILLRAIPFVTTDRGLYEMLHQFQSGKSHLAGVRKVGTGEVVGIITLEDVIEELIQDEIVDETEVESDPNIRLAKLFKSYGLSPKIYGSDMELELNTIKKLAISAPPSIISPLSASSPMLAGLEKSSISTGTKTKRSNSMTTITIAEPTVLDDDDNNNDDDGSVNDLNSNSPSILKKNNLKTPLLQYTQQQK